MNKLIMIFLVLVAIIMLMDAGIQSMRESKKIQPAPTKTSQPTKGSIAVPTSFIKATPIPIPTITQKEIDDLVAEAKAYISQPR